MALSGRFLPEEILNIAADPRAGDINDIKNWLAQGGDPDLIGQTFNISVGFLT